MNWNNLCRAYRFALVLGLLGLAAALATPASAAELPQRAPSYQPLPSKVVQDRWTGCYVGAHVGHARMTLTETSTFQYTSVYGYYEPTPRPDYSADSGFVWGGQLGCDWQTPGSNWVVGIGFDATKFGLQNVRTESYTYFVWDGWDVRPSTATYTNSHQLDWAGSVYARVGYAVERFMPFVSAGVTMAWGKNTQRYSDEWSTYVSTIKTSGTGYFAGIGLGYLVTSNIDVVGEYRRYWLPNSVFGVEQNVDSFLLRANYRFGG